MLVPLGFTGAVLWAWHAQHSRVAIGLGVLISYVVPLLILRPRWLGMDSRDRSWLPSGAALGVFVVCDVLTRAADAGLSALGGPAGSTVSFVLEVFVAWLSASALIFVRSWRATVPHLASRLNQRFAMLAVMGSLRPLALFTAWLLPPILLAFHHANFIAPTVVHLAAYLPEAVTTANRLFFVVANPVTDYWWVALIPLLSTAAALYVGRCLALFERHENEEAQDSGLAFCHRAQCPCLAEEFRSPLLSGAARQE
jgi:hypothetical protein